MKQMATARRQGYWDLRAAGNFIGGGTGTGLVLTAALAAAAGHPADLPLAAGLGCVMAGLSLVWLEIGKPWRAFNVFFHPQTSWMTREGILAGPLLAVGAGAFLFHRPELLAAAAVLAAGFLYCQARLLRASRAIPAWSTPMVVPLIVATALAEGSGAFLALTAPAPVMVGFALAAGLAREAFRHLYRRELVRAKAPDGTLAWFSRPEVHVLQAARLASLALLAAALAGQPTSMAGGILAMLAGWGLKAVMVTRAAYTRGARIPRTPVRGRGTSRIVAPS